MFTAPSRLVLNALYLIYCQGVASLYEFAAREGERCPAIAVLINEGMDTVLIPVVTCHIIHASSARYSTVIHRSVLCGSTKGSCSDVIALSVTIIKIHS